MKLTYDERRGILRAWNKLRSKKPDVTKNSVFKRVTLDISDTKTVDMAMTHPLSGMRDYHDHISVAIDIAVKGTGSSLMIRERIVDGRDTATQRVWRKLAYKLLREQLAMLYVVLN